MGMYDDIVTGVSENIKIGGYPFYAENINGSEPFNRRDYEFKPLLNGTLVTRRGKYIQRKFSFSTTLYSATGRPDAHDKILRELQSKPVEVISPAMGGIFKAVVTFSKSIQEGSKYHTDYDVDITEVPEKKSNIPGETPLVVPNIKKINATKKTTKTVSKEEAKLNKSLNKCKVPFRKGQKNNCVKLLQQKLINLGFLDKKHKTGVYDTRTVNAVKSFQRSTKGKLIVDGVFGKSTKKYLVKE
ncbi:peptidoglycan-binding protein [uncultured Methanobrevibacter sp.]|uniref:peptidoglycan-binding domain-containing protein n=1 Tax=uncultured Methanobrevibacter sp. TaxID=253161 RepID=UPI0025E5DD99|nr:peptidoglycan-binding domain-containing protein [uncultured Methanobrevibacter sp.]